MDRGGKVGEFKRGSKLPENLQNSAQAMCLQQQFDNSANVYFRVAAGVGARRHRDVLKKWESDNLDRIFAKFVRKVSPGPQTYQIKPKRADLVRTCFLFSNERTPSQVTDV